MPYPAKTDLDTVIEAARDLIERDGVDQLALGPLATKLGIKAPSLYRFVAGKAELLRAVNERTIRNLFAAYDAAMAEAANAVGVTAEAQLWAIFRAHRAFAHANPITYVQAFSTAAPGQRGDEDAFVKLVLPIQNIMASLTGEAQSLAALRGALALMHGFVMLELNNQFQRGGDLTEAYEAALAAYIRGWQRA